MKDFHQYYLEFLGATEEQLKAGQRVFPSELRSRPDAELSFNKHDLIVAEYGDALIHSITPQMEARYRQVAPVESSDNLLSEVDDAFFQVSPYGYYWISEWYRYSTDRGFDEDTDVMVLDCSQRAMIEGSLSVGRGKLYTNRTWDRVYAPMLLEGRMFAIVRDGRILSRSTVADNPCGGANIEVSTHESFRRRGLGSRCVRQAVNWCVRNHRVPVYLVSVSNTASIRLAEELGFTKFSHEIRTSALMS
jgi:GNAT superfamily N-acetyltransferase